MSTTRGELNQFHRKRGIFWRNKRTRESQKTLNNISIWGPWNLCLVALILLSIYNILLTAKLMYGPDCPKYTPIKRQEISQKPPAQLPCDPQEVALTQEIRFSNFDLQLGRWDNKLSYKIFDRVFIGDKYVELSEEYVVCLATQSSLERLSSLVQVTNNWRGPISAALFAAGEDELNLLLLYVVYLRRCFGNVRDRVTFHIVLPKERLPQKVQIEIENLANMNCLKPENTLEELLRKRSGATAKIASGKE